MCDAFPDMSDAPVVMGGRSRIAEGDALSTRLRNDPCWTDALNFLESERFVAALLGQLQPGADRPCAFDAARPFRLVPLDHDRRGLRGLMRRLQRRWFPRAQRLSVHLDVSSAGVGYEREVHTDNPDRLLAGIVYLDEISGSKGGDLVIHRLKTDVPLQERPRWPTPDALEEALRVAPQRDLGVFWASTTDSYHSVERIQKSSRSRRFIYIGVTSNHPNVWLRTA